MIRMALFLALLISSTAMAQNLSRHACLLNGKVSVLGASISAGWGGSPFAALAGAHPNAKPLVTHITAPGRPSSVIINQVLASPPGDVVVAIDMFFWDGMFGSCDAAVANVQKLLDWSNGADLIVGDETIGGCAPRLRAAVQRCDDLPNCHRVPLHDELAKLSDADRKNITVDGLHLSANGASWVASQILNALDKKSLNCESTSPAPTADAQAFF
jgi:hypothetical protein